MGGSVDRLVDLSKANCKFERYEMITFKLFHIFIVFVQAMMNHIDDSVHQIVDTLKERSLYDNTLIIVASDVSINGYVSRINHKEN